MCGSVVVVARRRARHCGAFSCFCCSSRRSRGDGPGPDHRDGGCACAGDPQALVSGAPLNREYVLPGAAPLAPSPLPI